MNIETEKDCLGVDPNHPMAPYFDVLTYSDGLFSTLPKGFFQNWLGAPSSTGTMYIGKGSALGVGSIVKYDAGIQSLRVGRFVAGGMRLKFILNGQHEMKTMSTSMFSYFHHELRNPPPPQYGDTVIKNDVWMGDEMMMLGGGEINNGCIIGARSVLPPNFKSEPYGIYAGNPARLIRFRFSDNIIESLLDIAWWDQPDLVNWLKLINGYFMQDFTEDEAKTLALLEEVKAHKAKWLAK